MRETSGDETGGRLRSAGAVAGVVVLDVHPGSRTPAKAKVMAQRRGKGEVGKGEVLCQDSVY